MDTLESLQRKLKGADDLKSVVRTMKALAASNIGQYELALTSLEDYYRTVSLGITGYLRKEEKFTADKIESSKKRNKIICAIVFGSDQGLVGQFNDSLTKYVSQSLHSMPGTKQIWAVGERVQLLLSDAGFTIANLFPVPNSVNAITPLVGQIVVKSEESHVKRNLNEFYIFHNQPKSAAGYEPKMQRFLPLDEEWRHYVEELQWPTKKIPELIGGNKPTLLALIHEYLFVSLFTACAESWASENASRLDSMQRAEKNIEELLDSLSHRFHRFRQSSIDEELFDVVSGFEAIIEGFV